MKLFVLIGQRKCRYAGEYSPEALCVADDLTMENNPDYMEGEYLKYEKSDEFSRLVVVPIQISDGELNKILSPKQKVIDGKIVPV